MSEEFKNEFDESKETETDNVNMQEETETVFEDNASKPGETTNESAVTQEPGNAPTPENPIYARAYQTHEQRESTKEEWYQEAQQEQKQQQSYNAYQFTAPESKKPNRSGKKLNGQGRKFGTVVATAVVFGLVASAVFQGTNYVGSKLNPQGKKSVQVQSTQTISQNKSSDSEESVSGSTEGTSSVSQVAKNAMPSIVSIVGVSVQEIPQIYQYFGYGQQQETQSSGSGIIVGQNDTELLIATNNHVVESAEELTVQFADGSQSQAQIKGTDADKDLAVIAVQLSDISSDTMSSISIATLGDSNALTVGEPVIAIGNALGYGQSVTTGVVSALNRAIASDGSQNVQMGTDTEVNTFIQTDAAINPGNSGGALLNIHGEVIGINSNKIGGSTVEGMGYAIPISDAKPIIENLMTKQTRLKVNEDSKGYLGITGIDVVAEYSEIYGMPQGVYVSSVTEGTGAAQAGLVKGDIITALNGEEIKSMEELKNELSYYAAGTTVELTIMQGSPTGYQAKTVQVTLGSAPIQQQ